jgi:hypothetical protein
LKKRNKVFHVLWQGIALVAILVSLLVVGFGASIVYAGGGTGGGGAGSSGGGAGTSGGGGSTSGGGVGSSGGGVNTGGATCPGCEPSPCFTATIDPNGITNPLDDPLEAGTLYNFTLTVTGKNIIYGGWGWGGYYGNLPIGRVDVDVPDGFQDTVANVDALSHHPRLAHVGWGWAPFDFTYPWSSGYTNPTIWAQANSWNACLWHNDWVDITFDATTPSVPTPPDFNPYEFTTTAHYAYIPFGSTPSYDYYFNWCGNPWYTMWDWPIEICYCGEVPICGDQPVVNVKGVPPPPPPPAPVPTPFPEPTVFNPLLTFDQSLVTTPVLVVDVQGTVVRYPVTQDGKLLVDAMTTSPDGIVSLLIPKGCPVLNPDSTPAYLNKDPDVFSISAAAPAAPAGYTMMAAYEFMPKGVIFSCDATIIIKYDAAKLPAGGTPVIAYYDEAAGKWTELETAGYVAGGVEVPNTVQAHTSHPFYFAVLAK